jgi:polysaccharide export outer membrane protein
MKFLPTLVLSTLLLLLFNGCVPYDKLVSYKQDSLPQDSILIENAPEIRIQPNDVLNIQVYSLDTKTAAPFNLTPEDSGRFYNDIQLAQLNGYLVDRHGNIDFPVLGELNVGGKTTTEIKALLKKRLEEHLKEPVVNVRLLNFRITVAGEVLTPGSFNIINERITIPEAISMAGDLTAYADRSNVLVVREEDGNRIFHRVNLLSSNVFQSDIFYLKQNDYVYVEPIAAKTGAVQDQTNKTIPIITAAATLIAVVLSITQN